MTSTSAGRAWKAKLVTAYLREQTSRGDRYFKSRHIAGDLRLSPQAVGTVMAELGDAGTPLDVEKWSNSTPVTWRVSPPDQADPTAGSTT